MQHQGKLLTLPGRNSTWQIDVNIACLNWGLFGSFWYGFKAAVVNKHFPLARRSWAICLWWHQGVSPWWVGPWCPCWDVVFTRVWDWSSLFVTSQQAAELPWQRSEQTPYWTRYIVPRMDLFGVSCKDILARRPPLPSYVLIPPQQWSSNHSGHDLLGLTISWLRFCHSLQHDPTREPALYRPWGNVRLVTPPPAPTARRIVLPQIINARRVFTGVMMLFEVSWSGVLDPSSLRPCVRTRWASQPSSHGRRGGVFAHTSMGCQLKQSALATLTRFGLLYCSCSSFLLSLVCL